MLTTLFSNSRIRLLATGMVFALAAGTMARAGTDRGTAQALITGFLQSWETGDEAAFTAALHPEVLFAYPGGRLDYDEITSLFAEYQAEKKDIKIYFADYFITNGETHVTAYQFAATDRETDQRFAVGTGVVCQIKDGKIVLFKEYWDSQLAPMQKAGELPLDEGEIHPWPASVWLRPDTID